MKKRALDKLTRHVHSEVYKRGLIMHGIELQAKAHPIAPWWRRAWFRLIHRIDPRSLVTVEIEVDPLQKTMEETMDDAYENYLNRKAAKKP